MANTRDLLRRRKSATNTRKICRTMELVASAKLRKAQDAASASRPYAEALADLAGRLAAAAEGGEGHPLMRPVPATGAKVVIFVVCSDRGLCGSFNANLTKLAMERVKAHKAAGRTVSVVTLGKKAVSTLSFNGIVPVENHTGFTSNPRFVQAVQVFEPWMKKFVQGAADQVEVIYSRFESAARQRPDALTLLPAGGGRAGSAADQAAAKATTKAEATKAAANAARDLYLYSPGAKELLDAIIPQTVKTALFSCLLQTAAGEHAARRTAMKNASDSAKDLIKAYTRSYNRARQGKITQEISEIVGAVEAMA